jgi:hypothetical protein
MWRCQASRLATMPSASQLEAHLTMTRPCPRVREVLHERGTEGLEPSPLSVPSSEGARARPLSSR